MLQAEGLSYEDLGVGEPVLLIHGGAIAVAFVPLTREAAFADRYRLIRYHRRGFGGSTLLAGPQIRAGREHCTAQVEDALALLRHLDVDRAHVVGHSGGGCVAVQLALDAPGIVHSLVLLEPAIYSMKQSWAEASAKSLGPLLDLYQHEPDSAAELLLSGVVGAEWRAFADCLPGGSEQWIEDTKRMFFEFMSLLDWSFGATDASGIVQPVLYMTGGDSPPFLEKVKDLFSSWVPQTKGAVIPGTSHNMHMQEPSLVAGEIARFFDKHPM